MSVRQVWRETAALFWQYPVLWLPVLGADLISFFLTRLEKYVKHLLIYHVLLEPASVLGGRRFLPGSSSNAVAFKAAMSGATLEWSMHFAQIIFYTTAFFMTASLIRRMSRREMELISSSVQFVRSRWRAVFGLSLRVLGLVALFVISYGALIAFTTAQTRKYMVHPPTWWMYVMSAAAFCGMAYFAAPMAMRRIGAMALKPLKAESKRNGRIFAVLTVLVSSLLGYGLPYFEGSFTAEPLFSGSPAVTTLEAIVSLLVALPYVVLFIALTLMVDGDLAVEPLKAVANIDRQEPSTETSEA
jgi:preprotein translocase subunit SecG